MALLVILIVLVGLDFMALALGLKLMFPWQLKGVLRATSTSLQLLDIRSRFEYRWGRIPQARNRPGGRLPGGLAAHLDPRQPVVIICLSGHRSPLVAWRLKKNGVEEVYHLVGGRLLYRLLGGNIQWGREDVDGPSE